MLDPWIIEEIKKKEEEKRREQERQQPTLEIEEPREEAPGSGDRPDSGHEMPVDRKPGHEMPNPNETPRPSEKKKDEAPKRGVDTFRISGGDDEDEDDGAITIDIGSVPATLPEDSPKKTPEKKPD